MINITDMEHSVKDAVLKISYVEFPARDLPATQIFYEKVFGWHFSVHSPEYCTFNDDMLDGGFYQSTEHSSIKNGAALVVLYSNNIEAARNRVVDAGGSIIKEIYNFPRGRRFRFADPNGNELAVWSDK